jgi:hypothetical protein
MTVGLKVNGYTSGVWLVSVSFNKLIRTPSLVVIVICHLMEDHSMCENAMKIRQQTKYRMAISKGVGATFGQTPMHRITSNGCHNGLILIP